MYSLLIDDYTSGEVSRAKSREFVDKYLNETLVPTTEEERQALIDSVTLSPEAEAMQRSDFWGGE